MENRKHPIHPAASGAFAFANVLIDADAHRLTRDGRDITVEPKAFAVLLEFLAHPGQLLSRDALLDAVWGHNYVTPGTLSRIIAQLRRALADDSENPHCIQTVHALGYRFIASLQKPQVEGVPALRFSPSAQARLPQRTSPLIGRENDIEQLQQLLQNGRLVTVIGAGGIGKTQTALEVARRVAADFPDGVWLSDCTMLEDEIAVARGLAELFDIRVTMGAQELIERLGELLRERHLLLLFDNCERIAAPLGKLVEILLAACADVRVLVTSQHRLNCAGEGLFWLPPLEVPPLGEWATDEQVACLSQVPAMQLLLTRSRAFASSFALTPTNAHPVAEICRRLDGLPLALEIAAARLRLLSPQQLLARMDAHLLNLAETSPSRPARHQTLHALIAWSFTLLSEAELSLLGGLSVFAGACTLGGANAVGAVFGLVDEQVLDLLGSLVDKSLLAVDTTTNPPCYRLLDSVRLFAREKLAESGDEPCVRDAHLAHFVQLAEHANESIRGDRQQLWSERVRREWANLRVAFDHALSRPDGAESALALSGNLCWYLRMGGDYVESANWLDQALRAGRAQTRQRAQALIAIGIMNHQMQAHEQAGPQLREGIALAMKLGDLWLAGAGKAVLAFELATCGEFTEAGVCAESALSVAEAQGDPWLRSMALLSRGITHALNNRHRDAEACLGDAFDAVTSPSGDPFQKAYILINRALQRFYLGDLPGAAQDWLFDLDIFIGLQHWRGVAGCVEGAAYLASERGDAHCAARFLAAAAHLRELTQSPLMPQWRNAQVVAQRRSCEELGQTFEQVRRDGAGTRFEQIADEARALLEDIATA
ncbi:winged helix-turn-helix domain-containing protein [Rhodanobacter sp. AS-Z3]|uniref:ATP-binding protein n=1 Tax=Rhodanobacter sp. AS-Z3 TaxID=3031330 RepID=UPI00247A0C0F|nr:winged helix-turn-helix domain-containing protein [Rhodanobacter sp. AS-Z3]WEN14162.1 winged helix-turn-helix domain-containing protein [Rhodanobacter sp. AS-Z3]